jgi:cytoplasmic iron level regulating protein YaaA (DUF328/UPF0246 family)
MLILLSPAKTLDYSSKIAKINHSIPSLISESEALIKQLRKKSASELTKLMAISEKLAEHNAQRYKDFSSNFTETNSRPAIFAFKGDVYQGLEVETYSKPNLDFAQKQIIVRDSKGMESRVTMLPQNVILIASNFNYPEIVSNE